MISDYYNLNDLGLWDATTREWREITEPKQITFERNKDGKL